MHTYPSFQSSHVVYVKMPFHPPDQKRRWYTQSGHFYVGSTAISAVKCEFDRFAKLKQIRRNLAVHAELSICYWSRTDFESYTCIVLQACTTYNDAWVREHLLISSWQPALNHPFILKFLKLKSEGWMMQLRKNRQGPVKLSPRLYQRVRRRLFSLGSVPSPHSFQEQAWRIVCQISLFTRASYEACKRIRSGEFHTLEVYALYRPANHMEEPGRSRVKSLIGKALLFRNATVPKNNLPLHIPFLALDNFRTNLETWIRQLILQHKNVAIPLVLPTHRLREQGFPKLSEILHNHRKVERRWITSDIENLPCCCKELRSIAKQLIHKTGHVAINLDDVNLPSKLHIFANANANSTYFHSRSQYFNICSNAIIRWLKHHGLPPQLAFKFLEKITAEWKLHLDAIDNLHQFTKIFFSCCSTSFTLAPQGLRDSSWWSWTISFDLILSSAIFSRCTQYLEGSGTFWTTTHFSTRSATSYSTGFSHLLGQDISMGLSQKKPPCHMVLSFWNGKRLEQR